MLHCFQIVLSFKTKATNVVLIENCLLLLIEEIDHDVSEPGAAFKKKKKKEKNLFRIWVFGNMHDSDILSSLVHS